MYTTFLSFQEKNFNVTLEDVSKDMGMLSLQGPLSRRILQKLTPSDTDLSDKGFPFSTCQTLTVAGHQVLALRVRYVFLFSPNRCRNFNKYPLDFPVDCVLKLCF